MSRSERGSRTVRLLSSVYGALLRVLPGGFRRRRGRELADVVQALLRDARPRGRGRVVALFLREAWDLVRTALRLWWPGGRASGERGRTPSREGSFRAGGSRARGEGTIMDGLGHDLRLAVRTLRRSPGFTGVVVLTLALGIGATTAIFSVVNGVLLRPLPFEDPERIVMLWQNDRLTGTEREAASVPDLYDFRQRTRSFEAVAGFSGTSLNLTRSDGEPRRLQVARVTHDLDDVLGVAPVLGRGIQEAEDRPGGPLVALVSDAFWAAELGRDPEVVGRTLTLNDEAWTVVGVLPADAPFPSADTDLWVPLRQGPTTSPRATHWVNAIARLADGVPLAAARAEMDALAAALEEEYAENRARGAFVEPLPELVRGDVRPALLVLFGAVLAVLLIACANVANLYLARGTARARELAVSAALGASPGRLAARFLAESALTAGAAAVLGVVLAQAALQGLLALAPGTWTSWTGGGEGERIQAFTAVGLDPVVLLFAVLLTTAVAAAFGLLPLRQSLRLDLQGQLKDGRSAGGGGLERLRLRRLLVVSQMAGATVLLVGSGLLIHSLWRLQRVDPGFRTENVLRATWRLPVGRYPQDFSVYPDWPEINGFNQALLDRLQRLPTVRSAALVSNHPLDEGFTNSFVIRGRENELQDQGELRTRLVSPGYFETVGLQVLRGRSLEPTDRADAPPVLLLNEAAVARYFPDSDPMGARISFWGIEREVVGVVADERIQGLDAEPPPAMYASLLQAPTTSATTALVRTDRDSRRLADAVRDAIWSLDRDLAVYDVVTMEETLAASLARERFTSILLGVFAALALLIAAIGVHGVLSYLVARRTHEMGVRMALGASRGRVRGMVVGQGMALALAGVVLGLLAAAALAGFLERLLFGVSARDPVTYAVVGAVLAASALLACALPAGRATRVDPVEALRTE